MLVQVDLPEGIFARLQQEQIDRRLRSPRAMVRQIMIDRYATPYEAPRPIEKDLETVAGLPIGCQQCQKGDHCGNTIKEHGFLAPRYDTEVLVECRCAKCKPEIEGISAT